MNKNARNKEIVIVLILDILIYSQKYHFDPKFKVTYQ